MLYSVKVAKFFTSVSLEYHDMDDQDKIDQILEILRNLSGRLDNVENTLDRVCQCVQDDDESFTQVCQKFLKIAQNHNLMYLPCELQVHAEASQPAREPAPDTAAPGAASSTACPDPPPSPSSTFSSSDSRDEKSDSASTSTSTSASTSFSDVRNVFELRADEKADDDSVAWRSFQLRREPNADVVSTIDELKKVHTDINRASAKWQRQMVKQCQVKNLRADVRRTKRGAVLSAIEAVRKYRASSRRLSNEQLQFLNMVEHYVDGVHNALYQQPRNCWYLCATDDSRRVNLQCTGKWIANFNDNSIAWQEESHHAERYIVRSQTQLLELVQHLRTSDVFVVVKHPPSQMRVFA